MALIGGGPTGSSAAVAIGQKFTDGTLIAISSEVVSGWLDLEKVAHLHITRTATGGTYDFQIDWSRDGVTADVTETVTVGDNASVEKQVATRYARFRIRNTSGVIAFSAHRSVVSGH